MPLAERPASPVSASASAGVGPGARPWPRRPWLRRMGWTPVNVSWAVLFS